MDNMRTPNILNNIKQDMSQTEIILSLFMSVVLQKHSHHLVLGFSPPNNCKTKSSPTSAYFSPTPVGSYWQIICEITG